MKRSIDQMMADDLRAQAARRRIDEKAALQDEITRLRTALAESEKDVEDLKHDIERHLSIVSEAEKDKAALALAAAAMREQAAKVARNSDVSDLRAIASRIRALPLPDHTALSAKVDALVRAAAWALPLAERALEEHRMMRVQAGHQFGTKRVGLYDDEVEELEKHKAALQPLRDAGFGGGK